MAKKRKAPELSPEAIAANAAADARREKEKQARQKNAEKQKRFRDNMKAEGYKRVTLWDAPSPAGQPGRMAGMGYRQVPAWEMPEKNADKQKRFRDNMKEAGYKRVTLWDAPSPADQPGRMTGMGYRQVPAQ